MSLAPQADNSDEMAEAFRTHNLDKSLGLLSRAMDRSLMQGSQILKDKMQAFAPVWTGRMQRSVRIDGPQRREDTWITIVGPTVDYAKFTELEPWIIGKRPGPKSQMKGAKIPWMAPAAEEVRDEVRAQILAGVGATVKGLQGGLGSLGL